MWACAFFTNIHTTKGMTSRSALYSRYRSATYRAASESSEADLLEYSNMSQLHPPYVLEASAVAVKPRANDPKRYVSLEKEKKEAKKAAGELVEF